METQDNSLNRKFGVEYNYTSNMLLNLEQARDLYYRAIHEGRVGQVADDYRIPHKRKSFEEILGEVLTEKGVSSSDVPGFYKDRWEKNVNGDEY